jgi:TM2 domain-containing membrane protein YozV
MKCAVHSEVDAAGYCRNCGKALCSTCVRPVRDVLYCEDCLATVLGHAAPPPALGAPVYSTGAVSTPVAAARSGSNPSVAFILGFLFPGLGAVYNGEYNKALIQILVFASIIFGLSSDMDGSMKAVLGILLGGFVFYMAFDAMRVAKAKSLGETSTDPLDSWTKDRPIGPIILIALGALLLLNNFDWFPWYRVHQFWPLVLIAVGALMFRNRLGRRS